MRRFAVIALAALGLASCSTPSPRGTGDLGVVVERAAGRIMLVETTQRSALGRVEGLGDLSHASVVFSRDARYAYVFGRDGGLTKVDLLGARVERRVIQSGNAIGGAISQDGRLVAAANYTPGGIRIFDAGTLERERAVQILIWFLAAGVLWLLGGLADGGLRIAAWLAALALDYAAPLVVFEWARPQHYAGDVRKG